ncbi:hypothetical protein SynBIOSU31_01714 [Synechococcus sp. BIOS-U3-1]|nr:hypothetical protein SynBIOSU31_01714 [Synechococcus sp. BIOS-U3-1]
MDAAAAIGNLCSVSKDESLNRLIDPFEAIPISRSVRHEIVRFDSERLRVWPSEMPPLS